MTKNMFPGVMGMLEMEVAMSRMEEIWRSSGRTLLTTFLPSDFVDPDDINETALKGFVELVYGGWMEKPAIPYNGVFRCKDKLLQIIQREINSRVVMS